MLNVQKMLQDRWPLPHDFELSPEFALAFECLEETTDNFYVMGRPGAGKTTFLYYFCRNTGKRIVVVAPTGIAAIKAGGKTIHSFFGLPPKFIRREDVGYAHYGNVMRNIDAVVIDEVSMVRADVMDGIDYSLRLNRGRMDVAFGGVEVILIGDLTQLPPVVTKQERPILDRFYKTPFFFSADVFKEVGLKFIEFKKVYRQKDVAYLALLARVGRNETTDDDLKVLNQLVRRGNENEKGILTLTARNREADEINELFLQRISDKEFRYLAAVSGNFGEADYPVDPNLKLKNGAQVMLVKNDREGQWVNGTIAEVVELGDDFIKVLINGNVCNVEKDIWEKYDYKYNDDNKTVEDEVVGTFIQYPIILAWAITIHKSQGQTFDKVVIDFGDGAFCHGQANVALSRCRTFEGMRLTKPIRHRDIIMDPRILNFMKNARG